MNENGDQGGKEKAAPAPSEGAVRHALSGALPGGARQLPNENSREAFGGWFILMGNGPRMTSLFRASSGVGKICRRFVT